jgi:uncharacterized GH25 family protein
MKSLSTIALLSAPILAHDMWIEPAAFRQQPGSRFTVRLRVGQDLLGDPLPRDPALIRQFIVEDGAGRRGVPGRVGADPAGVVLAGPSGVMVIGYRSNHSSVLQSPRQFEQYLKEEGLDTLPWIRARKASDAQVSELFSRCAKSLVSVGAGQEGGAADRVLGFTLELFAERNPYAMRTGDELPVRLTFENRPLAGALVVAANRSTPSAKVSARTGIDGRVRLPLGAGGLWLIKTVHLLPAPKGSGADWESLWSSLTFVLPGK